MKLTLTLFVITFATTKSFSQNDASYYNLIYNQIRAYQRTGTVYYADKPYNEFKKEAFGPLYKSPVADAFGAKNKASITLTEKERAYILSQLQNFPNEILPDSLLPNSKRAAIGNIQKIVRQVNESVYDSLMRLHDTTAAYKFLSSGFMHSSFFFSKPIYIRNNSVLLAYFSWLVGNRWGGRSELCFYRKENNNWVKWIMVTSRDY